MVLLNTIQLNLRMEKVIINDFVVLGTILIATMMIFFSGFIAGHDDNKKSNRLQTEAVSRGYAYYNPTNGVWQWK